MKDEEQESDGFIGRNISWIRPLVIACVITMSHLTLATLSPENLIPFYFIKIVWVICLALAGFYAAITDTATAKYIRSIAPVALIIAILVFMFY